MLPINAPIHLFATELLHYPDGLRWSSRDSLQDLFTLWLLMKGEGEFRCAETVAPIKSGSCLLMRRWEIIDIELKPAWDSKLFYAMFYFDTDIQRQLRNAPADLPARHRILLDPPFMEGLLSRVVSQYLSNGPNDPGISALLHCALQELERVNPAETLTGLALDHYNTMMIAYVRIRDHPDAIRSIAHLAAEFSYSLDHFIRLFKKTVGVTPGEALIRSRIEVAKQMLRTSNRSISQIAVDLNYNDPFAFSRQFKARTGHNPTEYRNQALKM